MCWKLRMGVILMFPKVFIILSYHKLLICTKGSLLEMLDVLGKTNKHTDGRTDKKKDRWKFA